MTNEKKILDKYARKTTLGWNIRLFFLVFLQPESKCYHSEKLNRAEMKGDLLVIWLNTWSFNLWFPRIITIYNERTLSADAFLWHFLKDFFIFFSWSPVTRNRLRSSIKGDWTGCYSTQSPEESTRSGIWAQRYGVLFLVTWKKLPRCPPSNITSEKWILACY